MDPNACIKMCINSVTPSEWRGHMSDYANWRHSGGFPADPELLRAAVEQYYELRFERRLVQRNQNA